MSLLFVVVLVVAVTTTFTLFVRAKDVPPPEPVPPTRHLEERKATIYENLKDLQFEYRLGKLSDSDYQQTKLTLQRELAVVLAEIEKMSAAAPAPKPPKAQPKPKSAPGIDCPHCGAHFDHAMKFCGECGKAMT
ncbi:MAG TPA: hypothetical protein VKX39_16560 [Bryobacteraceae bacterium]|jgi:hypothetical protein|nr:hypothetical protein [Bryobacteraceae bacterium]